MHHVEIARLGFNSGMEWEEKWPTEIGDQLHLDYTRGTPVTETKPNPLAWHSGLIRGQKPFATPQEKSQLPHPNVRKSKGWHQSLRCPGSASCLPFQMDWLAQSDSPLPHFIHFIAFFSSSFRDQLSSSPLRSEASLYYPCGWRLY